MQHTLSDRYALVRSHTLALAQPLSEADCQVQSMPDASPTKWHLAHTTWFFETFVLEAAEPGFQPFHPAFRVLFNSYYNGIGQQHPRPQRGLITRPDLATVKAYRAAVDERVAALLARGVSEPIAARIELGLHHEQQHQELILTDLKHLLSCNPLAPVYRSDLQLEAAPTATGAAAWVDVEGGLVEIGHRGEAFAFDNESPCHRVWLQAYALADRLVTQGQWAEFIADGGYRDARWWLAAGWDWVRQQQIEAPAYWRRDGGTWQVFTLAGLQPLDAEAPLLHLSRYEADAYAHWLGAQTGSALRLPTEAEWEHAAVHHGEPALQQLQGPGWQWTASSYDPYPGFAPWAGAVGEYNGKFMVNQTVLRGGSCATPAGHLRLSYRNFFPADTRWQFTALRLARDLR